MVVRHFLSDFLQEKEITLASETSIRYNPFLTKVTIEDLGFIKKGKSVLSVDKAVLGIHLYKFLSDTIYINTLSAEGVSVDIAMTEEKQEAAGFSLAAESPEESEQDQQNNEEEKAEDKKPSPYVVVMPLLSLNDIDIHFEGTNGPHDLTLKQLNIADIKANALSQSLKVALKAQYGDGDINLTSDITMSGGSGKIASKLAINTIELSHIKQELGPLVENFSGQFSLVLDPIVEIAPEKIDVALSELELQLANVDTVASGYHATVNQYALQLNDIGVNLENNDIRNINLTGNTLLEGVDVKNANNNDLLSHLDAFKLAGIQFSAPGIPSAENIDTQIESVELINFVSSEKDPAAKEIPALAMLEKLAVETITYKDNALAVNKVNLSGINSNVIIDENKAIASLVEFTPNEEKTDTLEDSKQEETPKEPLPLEESSTQGEPSEVVIKNEEPVLHIHVTEVQFSGKNEIHFLDKSVSPNYERIFYIDEFNIRNIDNKTTELSPFHFVGRSNEYATVALDGGISPFTELVNLEVAGDVKELSLPPVSSYVQEALGFELKSGQLDTNIDVKVKESQLAGKVKLFIRGLDMSAAEKDSDNSVLKEQTAVPLNVALGMLKDGKGNIKLGIPMKGSVDDPSFGMSSFLLLVTKRAVMSQAKSYLMKTFVPYASVVSVAISAGEFIMKLRFEDLPFEATVSEVNESQHQYMDQFVALMKDKPKTQVKVCAYATPVDINKPAGSKITEQADLDAMHLIAKKRGESFKKYAVTIGGLESSRMLLCNPELDFGEKAKSRISISI